MYRSGAALLIVLFVVMVATILSFGFITSSDIELACGQNMALKAQMDSLAESGLVHARGLILNPQEVDETLEYWTGTGDEGLQLVDGSSDWYKVVVTLDSNDHRNYVIDCNAYRQKDDEQIGRSSLRATLRLNPCIAFWAETDTTLEGGIVINGDVYCNGNLTNNADINGDVFTDGTVSSDPLGQHYPAADADVLWPGDVINDLSSSYCIPPVIYSVTEIAPGIYSDAWPLAGDPKKVYYCNGQLELGSNVIIDGTLVVDANLVITGTGNRITAKKNFPALLVSGKLIIRGGLEINGLAIVTQQVVDPNAVVVASNATVDIHGGLFIQNGGISASSSSLININASPQKAAIRKWPGLTGDPVDWRQASGAFFKSITMF